MLKELTERLSRDDINKLLNALSVPEGVCHWECDATDFLHALKGWTEFNPFSFYQSLNSIRPDLISIALTIKWLCTDSPVTLTTESLTIKSFIEMLKKGISTSNLKILHTRYSKGKTSKEVRFETTMQLLAANNLIKKDLSSLSQLLNDLKLNKFVSKLQPYKAVFQDLHDQEFSSYFKRELTRLGKQIFEWETSIINYQETLRNVKPMLWNDKTVSLEKVYVDLNILKHDLKSVKLEDETTYNEIEYLRKISNEGADVSKINFSEELESCDPTKPEIWCFIGNAGCGKTFLCNRIDLRFGNNEISKFSYSLCIPCRNTEWHDIEHSRVESGLPMTTDFICQWLCLGLPADPRWITYLAKHIAETDGEGLLLIIDGLDEFTSMVPFQQTILYLLLTRRALAHSTILLTSRPGAYSEIFSSYPLSIDKHYQVMGFTPESRDLYFRIQINDQGKMTQLKRLLYLNEEMSQLSLIPINASLFATLIQNTDDIRSHTITELYTQLTTFLIRRQLSRMRLKRLVEKRSLFQLDSTVLDCIYRIGEVAYQGLHTREMKSSKVITLKGDEAEILCNCLGLAEGHSYKHRLYKTNCVWTFQHLTIQEYLSAIWLSMSSRNDLLLNVRYMMHSNESYFNFRMLFRFFFGMFPADIAFHIYYSIYKFHPTTTIQLQQLPKFYQYNQNPDLARVTGWNGFTKRFVSLSEFLFESNHESLYNSFSDFRKLLPQTLYFYFDTETAPNEWLCFVKSLPLLGSIQLIHFDSRYLKLTQFQSLLQQLTSCSLSCLSIKLDTENYSSLKAYCDVITDSQLIYLGTKISLEVENGDYTELKLEDSNLFQPFNSLRLASSILSSIKLSSPFLQLIANQLTHIEYLYLDDIGYDAIVPNLSKASQLKALQLDEIPIKSHSMLKSLLPKLSKIEEISLDGEDYYKFLPSIIKMSNLKYLRLCYYIRPKRTTHRPYLLQLLRNNAHTLRGLELGHLLWIGLKSWDELLEHIFICIKLVEIQLLRVRLHHYNENIWSSLKVIRCLLYLRLWTCPLPETATLSLCRGLVGHPSIREIVLMDCRLNSNVCLGFTHLIPTIPQLMKVDLRRNGLSNPDPEPIRILTNTAELLSVTLWIE